MYQFDKSSETNDVISLTTPFKSNLSYSLVTSLTNLLYLDSNHLSISSRFSYGTLHLDISILSMLAYVSKNEYVFLNGLKNLECTSFSPSSSNLSGVHTGDT